MEPIRCQNIFSFEKKTEFILILKFETDKYKKYIFHVLNSHQVFSLSN